MGFSSDKKIERLEIEAITGAPNSEVINNFILALLKKMSYSEWRLSLKPKK